MEEKIISVEREKEVKLKPWKKGRIYVKIEMDFGDMHELCRLMSENNLRHVVDDIIKYMENLPHSEPKRMPFCIELLDISMDYAIENLQAKKKDINKNPKNYEIYTDDATP
jgi:hypothetical protein